ncbi:hypothetical protein [Bosea sp. NPDC055594]
MQLDEKALERSARAVLHRRVKPDFSEVKNGAWVLDHDKVVAEAAITAYLQALSPGSTGETEGWVLVPKEPSSAQLDRAVAFALNVSLGGEYRWADYMRDLYGRFLSAAGER